jgi:hypothetical protein
VVTSPTPTPTPRPTGTPLPGDLNHSVVYCGRDGAPPFAIAVSDVSGANAEERITERLQGLEKLQPLGPTQDGPCPMGFPSSARVAGVTVQGDTVTVDYTAPNGQWNVDGAALIHALVQEIVYTASEEPSIRRVLITENGGQRAVIGGEGLVFSDPLTREGSLGYAVKADASFNMDGEATGTATTRWSVDQVAPGLARFVIEVQSQAEPKVTVRAQQNDERANPDLGKWSLYIEVAGATHTPGSQVIDKTPLRSVQTVTAAGTAARYVLGLDDLRPWRVALIPGNPARIVVDIGGPFANVTSNVAVYSAEVTAHQIHLVGAARAFEAHVSWRLKDASGRQLSNGGTTASIGTSAFFGTFDTTITVPSSYSGRATLEVFLVSAQDGSDKDLVAIPLQIQ